LRKIPDDGDEKFSFGFASQEGREGERGGGGGWNRTLAYCQ
jgi:hypothetical protein